MVIWGEEECEVCGLTSSETELIDAVLGREVGKICKVCAATTDSITIEKPTHEQLKEAERPFTVFERLHRAAKIKLEPEEFIARQDARKQEQRINQIKLTAKQNYPAQNNEYSKIQRHSSSIKLVSGFSEIVRKARNSRSLNLKQLAESIAESEQDIALIESGSIPESSERLVRKLEQFLRVDLIANKQENNIDFKSSGIKVRDLRNLRDEMFGRIQQAEKHENERNQASENDKEVQQENNEDNGLVDELNKF